MRRADFEAFRIASRWRECVVDDMSLAEIAVLADALLGPSPNRFLVAFLAPVLRYAQWVSVAKTINNWTIHWCGVRYTMDRHGRVTHIER